MYPPVYIMYVSTIHITYCEGGPAGVICDLASGSGIVINAKAAFLACLNRDVHPHIFQVLRAFWRQRHPLFIGALFGA